MGGKRWGGARPLTSSPRRAWGRSGPGPGLAQPPTVRLAGTWGHLPRTSTWASGAPSAPCSSPPPPLPQARLQASLPRGLGTGGTGEPLQQAQHCARLRAAGTQAPHAPLEQNKASGLRPRAALGRGWGAVSHQEALQGARPPLHCWGQSAPAPPPVGQPPREAPRAPPPLPQITLLPSSAGFSSNF